MNRSEILDTAKSYVLRDRAATHGDAERNFETIAQLWSVYTGAPLTAADVAAMMALLKVARIKSNPGHPDNWIDGAGYFACGGEIATADSAALAPEVSFSRACHGHEWAEILDSNGLHRQCVFCGAREYDDL